MTYQNFQLLLETLKNLGFDENLLSEELNRSIDNESSPFMLPIDLKIDEESIIQTRLHFHKSDDLEVCFLTKYEAILRISGNPGITRGQTFYISKGQGFKLGQAFNLLSGRAVYKTSTSLEGEKYNAWWQLNFEEVDLHKNYKYKQYRAQYGYDLEKVLDHYPIEELLEEDKKAALIKSMKEGNKVLVTFFKVSKTEKMFIEACPIFRTISICPIPIPKRIKPSKNDGSKQNKNSGETPSE